MKHTPEPWEVDDYIEWNIKALGKTVATSSLLNFCKDEYTANALRIVACVNACAGMDDPLTVINRLRGAVIDAACKYSEIEQQHAELLAALVAIRDGKDSPCHIANEAIAKAGGV